MSEQLTTEGRIFARQVLREIARREPLDASVFAGKPVKSWEDAIFPLFDRIVKSADNIFTKNAFKNSFKRLQDNISVTEQFHFASKSAGLITLKASKYHTLTVMEGEQEAAVIAQRHLFNQAVGIVICNVSDHALGRFRERAYFGPDLPNLGIYEGVNLAIGCAGVGAMISGTPGYHYSEINLYVAGRNVIATGNVKLSTHGGTDKASHWYDVRTVLPVEWCDERMVEQAKIVSDALLGYRQFTDVPYIPMRQDYVMKVLDASQKPKN